MMSQRSKRELVDAIRPRYLKAKRNEKSLIIDELVANTGYHRKHAIRMLGRGSPRSDKKRLGRGKIYQGAVIEKLIQIWEICGRICSKRLKPFIPEIIDVLERHQEIQLSAEEKYLLLRISRSTIDRCLRRERFEQRKGICTTKPGTLLKEAIAVRTFSDWDERCPGFMEIDTLAHCGGNVEGQFCYTLTAVDVHTGWTECLAAKNRSQAAVFEQIIQMRQRLPFPLLGLDCDNGGEFINDMLYRYCLKEHITFTRSRPYQKNDQAHVEQKNWSVVRRATGYLRYDTPEQLDLLNRLYAVLHFYNNFYIPVAKLQEKTRTGSRVKKVYDAPRTPYARVLASADVSEACKAELQETYALLDLVHLRRQIDTLQDQLLASVSRTEPAR
jgi:hypothetical protein